MKNRRADSGGRRTAREDWKAELQRRRRGGARVLETDIDFAATAAHDGHGHQRASEGGVRAIGLVRGAGRSGGWGSHGRTCAGGCFSAKIWGRFAGGDAPEF